MKLVHLETVDSTNIYAKKLIENNQKQSQQAASASPLADLNGTVIYADEQTAGHGRLGRPFYSPSQTGIYMSLIYAHDVITNPALITASTAVAVSRVLDEAFGVQIQIKWVNDLYLNGKKVCGILTEGHVDAARAEVTAAVVGIGINISTQDFPDEIARKAGGILNEDQQFDKEKLIEQIAKECLNIYDSTQLTQNAFAEYRRRSMLIGKQVTVHPVIDCAEKDYPATVTDITEDAKLKVRLNDKTEQLLDSGEVSLIL